MATSKGGDLALNIPTEVLDAMFFQMYECAVLLSCA